MLGNVICLEGNIVRDVELAYSANGNAWTRNAVAIERRFKNGDDWESETTFLDFTILDGRLAENFCESMSKGDRVVLTGNLRSRTVENDEGEKRTFYGVVVDAVGPSLRWATATIVRNPKGEGKGAPAGGDFFDTSDF